MYDHAVNTIAAVCEIFIFWMIWQDYRKARGKLELRVPAKRWLLMISLSLGPLVAVGLETTVGRQNEVFQDVPATTVKVRQTFKNQEVPLDGVRYVECTFENVTLVYNATRPYELTGNHFIGSNTFRSDSKRVMATLGLSRALGLGASLDIPGTQPLNK